MERNPIFPSDSPRRRSHDEYHRTHPLFFIRRLTKSSFNLNPKTTEIQIRFVVMFSPLFTVLRRGRRLLHHHDDTVAGFHSSICRRNCRPLLNPLRSAPQTPHRNNPILRDRDNEH